VWKVLPRLLSGGQIQKMRKFFFVFFGRRGMRILREKREVFLSPLRDIAGWVGSGAALTSLSLLEHRRRGRISSRFGEGGGGCLLNLPPSQPQVKEARGGRSSDPRRRRKELASSKKKKKKALITLPSFQKKSSPGRKQCPFQKEERSLGKGAENGTSSLPAEQGGKVSH